MLPCGWGVGVLGGPLGPWRRYPPLAAISSTIVSGLGGCPERCATPLSSSPLRDSLKVFWELPGGLRWVPWAYLPRSARTPRWIAFVAGPVWRMPPIEPVSMKSRGNVLVWWFRDSMGLASVPCPADDQIHLFLSKAVSFFDRSGLNVTGAVNATNKTEFEVNRTRPWGQRATGSRRRRKAGRHHPSSSDLS